MTKSQASIKLYLSTPHACPYLPGEEATTLIIDPELKVSDTLFSQLASHGFRRSGDMIYRPHCTQCDACVSVRIPVDEFRPNRSQQRNWRRNRKLRIVEKPAAFEQDHFELYLRYQQARHPESTMCDPDPDKYFKFLTSDGTDTRFFEMRDEDRLLGIAVADRFEDGLSAVYTFFEPAQSSRGLGVFAILWEIQYAKRMGCPWLYLGYWIRNCRKMFYKTSFRPVEGFKNGRWVRLPV